MKKQDSEEFPVFLRVGESVYTDEIKALHPLYSEDTNDLDGQLALASTPTTPKGYKKVEVFTLPVPKNTLNRKGLFLRQGMTLDIVFCYLRHILTVKNYRIK